MTHLTRFRQQRGSLFYPKSDCVDASPAEPEDLPSLAPSLRDLCQHHLGCLPISVQPLGEQGTFHRLFRAELPNGLVVAIRVSVHPEDYTDFPLLLDEVANRALVSLSLPCCPVYAVDLSRQWCPWDVALLGLARGVSLKHFDRDDEAISPLLHRLGQFLARLHRAPAAGFGLLDPVSGTGLNDSWAKYLANHLSRHVRICREIGALDSQEEERIERMFADAGPSLEGVPARLLHGDPGNHNVFVDQGQITALIDWEDCLAGDPLYEVAFWATFHPERRHRFFLAGYFSELSPPADFNYKFWLYFLRVALCKTVVRHKLGLRDQPGRPPASQRIQRALRGLAEPDRQVA